MKILLVALMIFTLSYADEMTRIEAIVDDITQLRLDYNECKKDLENIDTSKVTNKYKKLYEKEKQKNTILKAEVDFKNDLTKSNSILSKRIKELEKQLKNTKKPLKAKCKTTNNNAFPKLMMKEKVKTKPKTKTITKKTIKKKEKITKEKIIKSKASSFKLKIDSSIYNGVNGKKIDQWVKTTSFTSNTSTQNWIKVSGYFVDKKWKKAKQTMWIKKSQVVKK